MKYSQILNEAIGPIGIIFDSAVRGAVWLAVLALIAVWLRKSSASVRHSVWTFGILGVLILPILVTVLPDYNIASHWGFRGHEIPASLSAPSPNSSSSPARHIVPESSGVKLNVAVAANKTGSQDSSGSLLFWIEVGYLTIASIVLLKTAVSSIYLALTMRRCVNPPSNTLISALSECKKALGLRREVNIRLDDRRLVPLVWGIFRPSLLLPTEALSWNEPRLRAVLLHELAHVKRGDIIVLLLTRMACAVYWFNPLVWLASWRLSVEREQACDDLVISNGIKASEYAAELLEFATKFRPLPLQHGVTMIKQSAFESRLRALLDERANRAILSRRAVVGVMLVAMLAITPLGAIKVRADAADKTTKDQPEVSREDEASPAQAGGANVRQVDYAIGVVKPNQRAQVSAAVAGVINKLYVDVGESVKAGDPVAEVESGKYRLELELAAAKANEAKANLKRVTEGQRAGTETSASLLHAESEMSVAEVELKMAERDVENTVIRSPISGTVLSREALLGMAVSPAVAGAPSAGLFQISDLQDLAAWVEVPVDSGGSLFINQRCRLWLLNPRTMTPDLGRAQNDSSGPRSSSTPRGSTAIWGKVTAILEIDPKTGTIPVKVKIENPPSEGNLRSGSRVGVGFLSATDDAKR